MIRKISKYLTLLAACLCLSACSEDEEFVEKVDNPATVEFVLSGDVSDFISTRATNDEFLLSDNFQKPEYLYIFLSLNSASGRTILAKTLTGMTWNQTDNSYVTSVSFALPNNINLLTTTSARAYVVASKDPVEINGANIEPGSMVQTNLTEQDIRKLTFKTDNVNLRDVYSTPCNNLTHVNNQGGEYYVTAHQSDITETRIKFGSKQQPIKLYHVAARVDFIWSDGSDFPNTSDGNPDPDPENEVFTDSNDKPVAGDAIIWSGSQFIRMNWGTFDVCTDVNKLVTNNAKVGDVVRFYFERPMESFNTTIQIGQNGHSFDYDYKKLTENYFDLTVTQEMIELNVQTWNPLFHIINKSADNIRLNKVVLVHNQANSAASRQEMTDGTYIDYITRLKIFEAPTQGYLFQPALNEESVSYIEKAPVEMTIDYNYYTETQKKGRAHAYIIQPGDNMVTIDIYSAKQAPLSANSASIAQQSKVFTTWYKIYLDYYNNK